MLNINADRAGLAELSERLKASLKKLGMRPTSDQLQKLVGDLFQVSSQDDLLERTADDRVITNGDLYRTEQDIVAFGALDFFAWSVFGPFPYKDFEFTKHLARTKAPEIPMLITRDSRGYCNLLAQFRPDDDDSAPPLCILSHPEPSTIGVMLAVILAHAWEDHPEYLERIQALDVVEDEERDCNILRGVSVDCPYCEAAQALEAWADEEGWGDVPDIEAVRDCGHVLCFKPEGSKQLFLRHRCKDETIQVPWIEGLFEAAGGEAITKGTRVWVVDGLLSQAKVDGFDGIPAEGVVTSLSTVQGDRMAVVKASDGTTAEVAVDVLVPQGIIASAPPSTHKH